MRGKRLSKGSVALKTSFSREAQKTQEIDFPKVYRYKTKDPIHVSAQQIWMILISRVELSRLLPKVSITTTYGDVVTTMGMSPLAGRTIARQLGIIGKYCIMNDLPALNTIVVTKEDNLPGCAVVYPKGSSIRKEQEKVKRMDWMSIRPPTTGALRKVREIIAAEANN